MKTRFWGVLFILGVSVLLYVPAAQACVEAPVIDAFFAALNTGDIDTAVATFAEEATVEVLPRHEKYLGTAEIRPVLQAMQHPGRQFEVVGGQVTGDSITLTVEISDRGSVWGTQTIAARVNGDKLHALQVSDLQLKLW